MRPIPVHPVHGGRSVVDSGNVKLLHHSLEVVEVAELGSRCEDSIKAQPSDAHPGETATHESLEGLDAFVRSDGVQNAVGQCVAHPDVRPLTPVDRGRGQA